LASWIGVANPIPCPPWTIAEMEGEPGTPAGGRDLSSKNLGLTVQDITPEIAQRLGIENAKGVVVTDVADGSPAEDAGFNEGDIIRQINRLPVSGMAEFTKMAAKFKADKTTLFLVERGDARILLTVKTGK